MNAHEIKPGVIYRDEKVTVTAFATKHAMESYGYRLDTPDRSIVVSGDTNPIEGTIKACNGCDVLIHEAQPLELLAKLPENVQSNGAPTVDLKLHLQIPALQIELWGIPPNRDNPSFTETAQAVARVDTVMTHPDGTFSKGGSFQYGPSDAGGRPRRVPYW